MNITYGTALANAQLGGTAQWTVNGSAVTVPGSFAYTSAAGTVLTVGGGQSEAVTFTPTDGTDYATVAGTVTVNVAQATPTIVSVSPISIVYGTALAGPQLGGTVQWTVAGSTVSVAGAWSYTSAAGTVLNVTSGQSEAVTFTPTDGVDYAAVTSKATVTVTPAAGGAAGRPGRFQRRVLVPRHERRWRVELRRRQPAGLRSGGATATTGDWDGNGKTEIGYCYPDPSVNDASYKWCLDTASGVEQFDFGFTGSNVIPVVGDWNGDGKTEVGVYCNGAWFRDMDGSHTWDATNQAAVAYLGWAGASVIPVPGYWAGNGKTQMGVYCNGVWFLDSKGTGQYSGSYSYWGWNCALDPRGGQLGRRRDEEPVRGLQPGRVVPRRRRHAPLGRGQPGRPGLSRLVGGAAGGGQLVQLHDRFFTRGPRRCRGPFGCRGDGPIAAPTGGDDGSPGRRPGRARVIHSRGARRGRSGASPSRRGRHRFERRRRRPVLKRRRQRAACPDIRIGR